MLGQIRRKQPLENRIAMSYVRKPASRPSTTITVVEKYFGIMERLLFEFETNPFTIGQALEKFDGFRNYDHAKSILFAMHDDGLITKPKGMVDPHAFAFTMDDETMERIQEVMRKLSEKQQEIKSIYNEIRSKHSRSN